MRKNQPTTLWLAWSTISF